MSGIPGRLPKNYWHRDNPNYVSKRKDSRLNYRIPKNCKNCGRLLSANRSMETGFCGICAREMHPSQYKGHKLIAKFLEVEK